jgi:hypothetical protein
MSSEEYFEVINPNMSEIQSFIKSNMRSQWM